MIESLMLASNALLAGAFAFVAWGGSRLLSVLLTTRTGFFYEQQQERETAFLRLHGGAK